ncbi:Secondary metabolism regulator laeA [Apiospora kogelbergensis]|uniref:Secondary metabolism regulator laeA n=1 Tax=Apiospora kogelbergensis TaxID=1337665 RepID=UPI0031308E38
MTQEESEESRPFIPKTDTPSYARAKQVRPLYEAGDGDTVADLYSYVAEDGRTYQGYMPGGTGLWALEFAEENPTSEVIGTDLSMIQPLPWTPNCQFVLENSETDEWLYPQKFDYVHLRGVLSCFSDVRTVIRRAYDHLEAGGWIEFQDGVFELEGHEDGSFENTALQRWNALLGEGPRRADAILRRPGVTSSTSATPALLMSRSAPSWSRAARGMTTMTR